jgi:hypothetical protein
VSHYSPDVQHHAADPGSVATAGLALGAVAWAGSRWLHQRLKGHDDAGAR